MNRKNKQYKPPKRRSRGIELRPPPKRGTTKKIFLAAPLNQKRRSTGKVEEGQAHKNEVFWGGTKSNELRGEEKRYA